MKNIGVILAGGSGRRLGSELPKQFIVIAGKTVLAHTLHTFEKHERIDEIIIVVHKDYIKETEEIVRLEGFQKVKHIVPGGKERYASTLAALNVYKEEKCNLIIHDARPPASHAANHRRRHRGSRKPQGLHNRDPLYRHDIAK